MRVQSAECGVRSDRTLGRRTLNPPRRKRRTLFLALLLSLVCSLRSPVFGDWISDERVVASVKLPNAAISLKDVCAELGRQTSSEFFVDRRDAETKISWFADTMQLRTAMSAIEAATDLQWRMVGDMFFLSRDTRGVAVTAWNDRYIEAKKAQLAGIRKRQVKDWVYDSMPFPPSADMPWQLTPLQSEQLAYHRSLLYFTMTLPQLNWLDQALIGAGYIPDQGRTAVDMAAAQSFDVPLKFNAAMIVHTPIGDCLVEMPLTASEFPSETEAPPTKPAKVKAEPASSSDESPAKKLALKDDLKGLWITDADTKDLPSLLAKAKSKGYNAVFIPTLSFGHTSYPGKRLPQERVYKDTASDPLAAAIKAAGSLGMKVHAVLDATLWGDADHPVPTAANYPSIFDANLLGRTFEEQAKWQQNDLKAMDAQSPDDTSADEQLVYLCPASYQLPRLLVSVAEEIAGKYDVAGICLDGVDYPTGTPFIVGGEDLAPPYGYTLEVRREMIRLNQVDPIDVDSESVRNAADSEAYALWDKFRRGRLIGLITEVSAAFKAKKADGICSATLDLASDSQSPVHWSKIASLDAIVALAEIRKSGGEKPTFSYPKDESDALKELHRAVVKDAAVIPAVDGMTAGSLTDQIGVAAEVMKIAKDGGLKGGILRGDVATLSSALDILPD